MKTLKCLGKFLLIAGISVALSSCDFVYQVSEITQDTVLSLKMPSDNIIDQVSIVRTAIVDEIVINRQLCVEDYAVHLPAGGIYTVYPDSVVVTTANKHKLNIIFKEPNKNSTK